MSETDAEFIIELSVWEYTKDLEKDGRLESRTKILMSGFDGGQMNARILLMTFLYMFKVQNIAKIIYHTDLRVLPEKKGDVISKIWKEALSHQTDQAHIESAKSFIRTKFADTILPFIEIQ